MKLLTSQRDFSSLLVDYTELNSEKIHWQKHIDLLNEQLVELNALKNENERLETKLETLETQFDEINSLKEQIKWLNSSIDEKERFQQDFLTEVTNREQTLVEQVNTLEIKLRKSEKELKQIYAGNETLAVARDELNAESEHLKDLVMAHIKEVRALKERENHLNKENNELIGENLRLLKHIGKLNERLVEFEALRHEKNVLEEKIETLEIQITDMTKLKRIGEKKLERLSSYREEKVVERILRPISIVSTSPDDRTVDIYNLGWEELEKELNEFKDDFSLALNGVVYMSKRLANYARNENGIINDILEHNEINTQMGNF